MIEQIIKIVKDASAYMRLETASVEEKTGVENIVTSADLAVQKYLEEKLLEKGNALKLERFIFGCENENDYWSRGFVAIKFRNGWSFNTTNIFESS